jgi:hypothetical protein
VYDTTAESSASSIWVVLVIDVLSKTVINSQQSAVDETGSHACFSSCPPNLVYVQKLPTCIGIGDGDLRIVLLDEMNTMIRTEHTVCSPQLKFSALARSAMFSIVLLAPLNSPSEVPSISTS